MNDEPELRPDTVRQAAEVPPPARWTADAAATAEVLRHTGQTHYFRLNGYASVVAPGRADVVHADQTGPYRVLGPREPLGVPPANRPGGCRFVFPFEVGAGSLAENAAPAAARAMAVRSLMGVGLLCTPACWATPRNTGVGNDPCPLETTVRAARADVDTRGLPVAGLRVVMSPVRAQALFGDPRRRDLAVADVPIVVENAVVVENADGTGRRYVWPADVAVVLCQGADKEHSTLQFVVREYAVERRDAPDGPQGRLVEDYRCRLARPDLLFPVVWEN